MTSKLDKGYPAQEEEGDRLLLGEYPPQSKDIVFPEDFANQNWADDMDTYPERDAEEDPRWALGTVWVWLGFDLLCVAFIATLMILGAFFD
jgi:hypothetical protein